MPEFDTLEERRSNMAELLVRNDPTLRVCGLDLDGGIGLHVRFEGLLSEQTGSLRDILRGKRPRWEVYELEPTVGNATYVELIVTEIDDD